MAKVAAKHFKSLDNIGTELAEKASEFAEKQIRKPPLKLSLKKMFSSKLVDTDRQFFRNTYKKNVQKKMDELGKTGGEWDQSFRKKNKISDNVELNTQQVGNLQIFKKEQLTEFNKNNMLSDADLDKLYNTKQQNILSNIKNDNQLKGEVGKSWMSKNPKKTGLAVVMGATGATALATGQSFKDASKDVTDTLRDAAEPAVQVSAEIATQTAVLAADIAAVGAETIVDNSAGLIGTIADGTGNILGALGISGDWGFGDTFSTMYYLIGAFAIFYIFKSMTKAGDTQVDTLIYG